MTRDSANPAATLNAAAHAVRDIHPPRLAQTRVARAQKLNLLLAQLAMRGLGNGATSAAVLPLHMDAQAWQQLAAMQLAVLQRLQQQHKGWLEGMAALAREYEQVRQANTLSKFVEQEYNLVAQFGALLADQASQFAGLLENTQVDYGYWVAQLDQAPARLS